MIPDMGVHEFAEWWMATKPLKPPADNEALRYVKGIHGVTLYRDGQFQVQLFIGVPGSFAPKHAHPNIDSIDIVIAGRAGFVSERGEYDKDKRRIHVLPNEMHVTRAGRDGGAFFTIQKWRHGMTPTSVEMDWIGEPIDADHAQGLNQ